MRRFGSVRLWRWRLALLALMSIAVLALWVFPAFASAAGCPNEMVRKAEPYGSALPDCRAYEQVSPVNKNNTDAQGAPYLTESSPSGEAVAYYSLLPFAGVEGASEFPTYVSSFGAGAEAGAWATHGLLPPANPASFTEVQALTEDLDYAIIRVGAPGPLLGEASIQGEEGTIERAALGEKNTYVRDNATGEYRLLAPGGGTVFDDSSRGDSMILFEDQAKLTEKAKSFLGSKGEEEPGVGSNLYEWKDGVVTLVGLLPNHEVPTGGLVAGPGGHAITEEDSEGESTVALPGGGKDGFDLQRVVSENGTRIFFTSVETGQIYMREPAADRTVEVSSGHEPAYWRTATPDGSYSFYTEGEGANRNLYRFAVEGEKREALTSGEAHVVGTLGVSNDGSYVYFVAKGVLASNENGEKEKAEAEQNNLYEWHSGNLRFITLFGHGAGETHNWDPFSTGGGGAADGLKSSRVTPAGTTVLFSSAIAVTAYNNNHRGELYLYDAQQPLSATNPTCVSCNPDGLEATQTAHLTEHALDAAAVSRNGYITSNLSSDGNRVFFQTEEALLPQDTNGQVDVYEWEREDEGSCAVGAGTASGGCVYLISSGQGVGESYFGDAGADGSNVFFFTRQSLVAQDQDENVDVYDARETGGLESQNRAPVGPCGGEGCRGSSPPAPVFQAPSSVTLSGSGNLAPPVESKPIEPKVRPLTRAQKLAAALKACEKKPKNKRAHCRAQAQNRYGTKAKKSSGRDK